MARRRVVVAVGQATAPGVPIVATFDRPPIGLGWLVEFISVELPGYGAGGAQASPFAAIAQGAVPCVVELDGQFVAGTNQGQADSGPGDGFTVADSQILTVTWNPSNVLGTIQGRAKMWVLEGTL